MTVAQLCESTRATLVPCVCGAPSSVLRFQMWGGGTGANVWCARCGYGTPARHDNRLIEQAHGVIGAAARWNALDNANAKAQS